MNYLRRPAPDLDQIRNFNGSDWLIRVCLAVARNCLHEGHGAEVVARDLWPADRDLPLLVRAAVAPAGTASGAWGSGLAATSVADLVTGLPQSAASRLFRKALIVHFGRSGSIFVPSIATSAANVTFVAQGSPIPVRQLLVGGPILAPRKLAIAVTLTRETVESSTPNAERLVRAALTESLALALDAALFDDIAGDDIRPPGLRFGIAAATATAGGGPEALVEDLAGLAADVAAVAGDRIVFVVSAEEAIRINLRMNRDLPYPVFSSAGLPSGTLLAIAPDALAVAIDPVPRIESSTETILHSDTAPTAISASGSMAPGVRSLFQSDAIAIRLILQVSWGLRSNAISWTSGVTW